MGTERRMILNSNNPVATVLLSVSMGAFDEVLTRWMLEPSLFSHWTVQPTQAVSPCGVARQNARHLNSSEKEDYKKHEGYRQPYRQGNDRFLSVLLHSYNKRNITVDHHRNGNHHKRIRAKEAVTFQQVARIRNFSVTPNRSGQHK